MTEKQPESNKPCFGIHTEIAKKRRQCLAEIFCSGYLKQIEKKKTQHALLE